MEYKRKKNIQSYLYNPSNLKEAKAFINQHNMSHRTYFSEEGLEDVDKTGSLELDLGHDGITLEVGQYLVIDEDGYTFDMWEYELNDFVEKKNERK